MQSMYNRRVGKLLAVVALIGLAACAPAPVLNPDKAKEPGPAQPEIERTVELTSAPGGTVTTLQGGRLDLASLWEKQPVVVIFYRGHWCPHCQYQLGEINTRKAEITARGATVVAISSDEPENLAVMRDKLGLAFELYSDAQLAVIQRWGVEDFGQGIARPATFVVQPGGAITFQKVGDKPEDRPSFDAILAALPAPEAPAATAPATGS